MSELHTLAEGEGYPNPHVNNLMPYKLETMVAGESLTVKEWHFGDVGDCDAC